MSQNKGDPNNQRKLVSKRGNSHGTKWPVKLYARRLARRLSKQIARLLKLDQ